MSSEITLLAKIAALKSSFDKIEFGRDRCYAEVAEPLFSRYFDIVSRLKEINPDLYSDIPGISAPERMKDNMQNVLHLYTRSSLAPMIQNLTYILELSSNVRIGGNQFELSKPNSIFISHGQSSDWRIVQAYLEKDLGHDTLELAQQPNLGRSVLQKLLEESESCSVAVIVMTGDDKDENGQLRARENVMHELGYFQGLYGPKNVILLHENEVNIPSNINGLVYIPFAKNSIESAFIAIARELKVLMK